MRKRKRRGGRPPWWFKATIFAGLGGAVVLIAAVIQAHG